MVIPYLSFSGNCEEAFALYLTAFGGKVNYMSRYTVVTGGPVLAGKVMHMEATIGNSVVAGADQTDSIQHNDSISLMVHFGSRTEAEKCFDMLAKEGQALQRLTPHPPPDDGGMGSLLIDKFGYKWILTSPNDHRE